MKFPLLMVVSTLLIAASAGMTSAQTPAPATTAPAAPPAGKPGGMLSSLSEEDKAKLIKARTEVLQSNPDLKAEQDDLMKQREAMRANPDAAPEDKMALYQSMMAHEQKMKAAMLKVDPTLQPVLDKLDAEMKQRMAQRAAAMGGAGN
jgi:hypothetical protein